MPTNLIYLQLKMGSEIYQKGAILELRTALRTSFFTKIDYVWRHDYRSENAWKEVPRFSVNSIEFEFQKM